MSSAVAVLGPRVKTWEFPQSNASQSYASHGFFRYFGKLPPVVTGKIIDYAGPTGPVLDIMCGSGTTLVECCLRGVPSVGIDVNPLSILVSQVKTTSFDLDELQRLARTVLNDVDGRISDLPTIGTPKRKSSDQLSFALESPRNNGSGHKLQVPNIRNMDYWFEPEIQQQLAAVSSVLDAIPKTTEKDFFTVAFLSLIRRVSNASPRIGRIFHRGAYDGPGVATVLKVRVSEMIVGAQEFARTARLHSPDCLIADGRKTPLVEESFNLVLCHPPYFALYKYSSDVLRFELDWGGFARKPIADLEIVDGFKTTERSTFEDHIRDMAEIMRESHRLLRKGGLLCIVTSNSTLREERLPVVEQIIERGCSPRIGFSVHEVFKREVKFAQASYHRSARADKLTAEDFVVFFKK